MTPRDLLGAAQAGDRGALARLVTMAERGGDEARAVGVVASEVVGTAASLGITGAPGAGKSTLTNALCGVVRRSGDSVGVLAIDPSSPFSGGAILGDRVRMADHSLDDGVFIRSMATRGHLGGLTLATPAALRVLDAAGLAWVIVETVGVGQVEVEVMGSVDTVVVVVNPGWGDAVQANKAGLMEIADVFVINKADRPGAGDTERDLRHALALAGHRAWDPPVIRTVATDATGIEQLFDAVQAHRRHLESSGEIVVRRRDRVRRELEGVVAARLADRLRQATAEDGFDGVIDDIVAGRVDPWTAGDRLMEAMDDPR